MGEIKAKICIFTWGDKNKLKKDRNVDIFYGDRR